MPRYAVLHRREWKSYPTLLDVDMRDFELVAHVDAADPEEAYRLTNHIDRPWTENAGVTKVTTDRVRSTSVNDVIVEEGSPAKVLVVADWGFKEATSVVPVPVPVADATAARIVEAIRG